MFHVEQHMTVEVVFWRADCSMGTFRHALGASGDGLFHVETDLQLREHFLREYHVEHLVWGTNHFAAGEKHRSDRVKEVGGHSCGQDLEREVARGECST